MAERAGLLEGKQVLIMGLANTKSFAWAIGQRATQEGANVIYTVQNEEFRRSLLALSFKRERRRFEDYNILLCDVTKEDDIKNLFSQIETPLDGLVHSVAFANPKTCLQETMFGAPREDILQALNISAVSLSLVAEAAREKFIRGGSVVAMTFDSERVYPHYNWMGVCKSALEATARYLARDLGLSLGVRVNCLSAGPQDTVATKYIPGFNEIADKWDARSPLGWNTEKDRDAVADSAIYLLSDLSRKVTGEVIHVDGGFHMVSLPIRSKLELP